MKISLVENNKEKRLIVKEVLKDLPEWFGMEEALAEYVENSTKYLLWVAKNDMDDIMGFINLKETAPKVGEIYCIGVKKQWHNKKIGTLLFNEFEIYAQKYYDFIQVKTVAEGRYKEYDQTIHFYRSIGFTEFEVFSTLWDEWNPCLIMIKSMQSNSQK